MKTKFIVTFLAIMGMCYNVFAQDYKNLKFVTMVTNEEYTNAEAKVLECSQYVLQNQMDEHNYNWKCALQYVKKWATGTPNYSFSLNETIAKATKSDETLLDVYYSSLSKYILENKDKLKDKKEVIYQSVLQFLNYCENPTNNVKLNGDLKKMVTAKNGNKLKSYLNL
jgi:hypothetical protein